MISFAERGKYGIEPHKNLRKLSQRESHSYFSLITHVCSGLCIDCAMTTQEALETQKFYHLLEHFISWQPQLLRPLFYASQSAVNVKQTLPKNKEFSTCVMEILNAYDGMQKDLNILPAKYANELTLLNFPQEQEIHVSIRMISL